jgi:hypothetical protein
MEVTRTNPSTFATEVEFLGKKLMFLDIGFGAAVNAKLGPTSTVAGVMEILQNAGVNIVIIGPLHNTNQNVSIAIEGNFAEHEYDGTNSETIAEHLEDVLQAATEADGTTLKTIDGVACATMTVTAKTFVL